MDIIAFIGSCFTTAVGNASGLRNAFTSTSVTFNRAILGPSLDATITNVSINMFDA